MDNPGDGLFMGFEPLQSENPTDNLSENEDELEDVGDEVENVEKSDELENDGPAVKEEDSDIPEHDRSISSNDDESKEQMKEIDEENEASTEEKNNVEEEKSEIRTDATLVDDETKTSKVDEENPESKEQDLSKENVDENDDNKENEHDTSEEMEVNTSVEEENSDPKPDEETSENEPKLVIKIGPSSSLKDDDTHVDDSDDDKMVIDEDVPEPAKQTNEVKVMGAKKRKQKFVSRVVDDEDIADDKSDNEHEDPVVADDDGADYVICPLTGEHVQKVIPTAVETDDKDDPGDEIGEDNYSDDDYCPSMDDRALTVHPKKNNKKKKRRTASGKPVDLKSPGLFKNKVQKEFSKEELEAFAKPFSLGWGREIVVRNAYDGSKKQMDTYYFNPNGKKLRSMVQVNEFLAKTNDTTLTAKNFTFARAPVYKEPFELVRNAGKSKVSSPLMAARKKTSPGQKVNDKTHTGNAKVKTPNEKVKTPKSSEKDSSKGVFKPKLPPNRKFKSEAVRRAEKIASSTSGLILKRRASESIGDGDIPSKVTKYLHYSKIEDHWKPCSLECPGMDNVPPSLQCSICLCLYHPKCAKTSQQTTSFVCPKCLLEKSKTTAPIISPKTLGLPKLQPKTNPISVVRQILPPLPKLRPMTPVAQVKHTQNIAGPPPLQRAAGNLKGSTRPGIAIVKGGAPQQPVVETKGGQLLTLPSHVISKLNLTEPLALKINGQALTVNPSCFVQTGDGIKIFLPANTLPATPSNKTIDVNVRVPPRFDLSVNSSSLKSAPKTILTGQLPASNSEKTPKDVNNVVTKDVSSAPTSHVTPTPPRISTIDSSKSTTDSKASQPIIDKNIKPSLCFVNKLDSGFDCMLQIFSYLSIPDLLRITRVCKRWRRVALEPSLWQTVMLKDCHVTDWAIASSFLERMQTHTLDLRGAHHADDRNRTWHQMTAVLEQMRFLKCFHFGQCPASILHAVSDKLVNLKVLTAEWITDVFTEPQMWSTVTKLDMGKFSQLVHLEELRLRGICGLVLPAFSVSAGMTRLSALKQLRKLSMTTLKDIAACEFGFIASLTNLEELEVGDCDSWTAETYKCLGKLTKLRRLRLENGGCHPDLGLADGLSKMTQLEQLQLMVFQLPDTLAKVLPNMANLKRLSLWPDTRSQAAVMNTNAMNAVKDLKSLKFLEWCTMKNNDEVSGADAKSVPFMTPDSNSIELKSAKELASTLKGHLPKTRIRVARLPVVSGLKKPDV
ncbi:uncharacterized protein LOC141914494 [Tubulanus polymorphus]|uniref:uncharacterized protein LOC141914494 n=1 Tax=Tubulanus polymorphus TaxID=672921 RepID=UPI003DA47134